MIHHWKGLDLEITDFQKPHVPTPSAETIHSQTSNPQTCRYYKISDKPTYDTSLERS